MRTQRILIAATSSCLALAVGCTSSGLSHREVRGQDYATYVFSMYEPSEIDSNTKAQPLQTPAKVAVAQLGEVAPPTKMIDKLRSDNEAFVSVQPMPGLIDMDGQRDPRGRPQDYSAQKSAQNHSERMRRYARDIGADYLFLYGGTVDRATTSSPASLANVTIVGAFLVPGDVINASARASGALIDVESGRVVLSVAADSNKRKRAARVAVEGDEIKVLESLRDDVVVKLADQLRSRVKEQSAG